MRIIRIAQRQSLRLDFRQDQIQDLVQDQIFDGDGFHGESRRSAIPKTTAFIKRHSNGILKDIVSNIESKGYKCLQDALLAIAIPQLKPAIDAYYNWNRKKMVDMLSPEAIAKVDDLLFAWLDGTRKARNKIRSDILSGKGVLEYGRSDGDDETAT